VRLTYVGHSTVLVELDGLRLLTDPVLRPRVAHIVRGRGVAKPGALGEVDVVLISHVHHDHFDPASLRMIDGRFALVVPRGARKAAARLGRGHVTELGVGQSVRVRGLGLTATYAAHRKGRLFDRQTEAIGFVIDGTQRIYFAGDTDVFPAMRELRTRLDVALLPVSGWGPTLGPGHLDPDRAAEALALIEPRVAVPIHWGTLYRIGLRRSRRKLLDEAPEAFARAAATLAPSVEVRVLQPGEATVVAPVDG
jgi:L-ascorbate metabolism protein UlaG (beta-lactamase superfamily)